MKNTLSTLALAAVLSIALIGTASAQTNAPATTAPATAATKTTKTKPTEYSGTITAYSATSVTVTNTQRTLTLAIDATTKFHKDKKPATAADFAVGDKVTGSYVKDATGKMTAHSLNKKTLKPATTGTTSSTGTATATH